MTRVEFSRYVELFNAAKLESLIPYYSPNVELYLPAETVVGPQAIVDRYRESFRYITEWLRVDALFLDQGGMAVEFYTRFEAHKDHPKFSAMPLQAGDVYIMQNFVLYDFDAEGRFKRIRVARWRSDDSGVRSAKRSG